MRNNEIANAVKNELKNYSFYKAHYRGLNIKKLEYLNSILNAIDNEEHKEIILDVLVNHTDTIEAYAESMAYTKTGLLYILNEDIEKAYRKVTK